MKKFLTLCGFCVLALGLLAATHIPKTQPFSSGNAILSASITLTDAQIKALPSNPIEIVPAPGANKMLVPFAMAVSFDPSAGAYTNVDSLCLLFLTYDNSPLTPFAEDLSNYAYPIMVDGRTEKVAGFFSPVVPATGGGFTSRLDYVVNDGLFLGFSNGALGNFTGGNPANTLTVTVFYGVVDVP